MFMYIAEETFDVKFYREKIQKKKWPVCCELKFLKDVNKCYKCYFHKCDFNSKDF